MSRDQHSVGGHPRKMRWTVTSQRGKGLTAVTQEKHLLLLCFDLICRFFWIFFFTLSTTTTPHCSCWFYWHYEIELSFWAFFQFFPLSHIFCSCYIPLHLCWAFTVLWSFPFFFILLFLLFFPILFLLFSFLFFIILIFNFLNLLYFFYIYSFV